MDADDVALLGRAVVPSLGDVVALYAADASGAFRLIGAAPDDGTLAPRAREHAEHSPGTIREIVAPLGSGTSRDGLLVIGTTDAEREYDGPDRSAVAVLAAIITVRRAARRQAAREAAVSQQVEALALAGRELAHMLNNDLTMPVGVVELLMDRNTSSPELLEMLQAAAHDLAALERHVRAFHDLVRERARSLTP